MLLKKSHCGQTYKCHQERRLFFPDEAVFEASLVDRQQLTCWTGEVSLAERTDQAWLAEDIVASRYSENIVVVCDTLLAEAALAVLRAPAPRWKSFAEKR